MLVKMLHPSVIAFFMANNQFNGEKDNLIWVVTATKSVTLLLHITYVGLCDAKLMYTN